jgi:class 3 adenylate cyclase
VFVGDILNTAARLEERAKRTGLDLVASQAVLDHMDLPSDVGSTRCGELALRGKESRVIAYSLTEG